VVVKPPGCPTLPIKPVAVGLSTTSAGKEPKFFAGSAVVMKVSSVTGICAAAVEANT
jgi:hypothetical protein